MDMKPAIRRILVFLFLVFVYQLPFSAYASNEVTRTDLSNGLTLLSLEDHSSPLVSIQVYYHVGTKNECPGMTGMTRICQWIMNGGTPLYKKGEFVRIIQAGGGSTRTFVGLDMTQFLAKVPSSMLDTVLFLEADRMREIEFTDEKLLLAKDAARKARLSQVESSIYGYINEEFFNLSFRSHPYGNGEYGFPPDIDAISMDDLQKYFGQFFQPARATLVVVGDFETERLAQKVHQLFGDIPSNPDVEVRQIVEPVQIGERYEFIQGFASIPVFIIGYHIPQVTHEDMPALLLISTILCRGESSRIHKRMVTNEKSAIVVEGSIFETEEPGMIYSYALLNYDTPIPDGEAQMDDEIVRLRTEPVTDSELEMAKNKLEADYYRYFRGLDDRAFMIGYYFSVGGDWNLRANMMKKSRSVTKENIMEIADKYFTESNRTVIYLQPSDMAEENGPESPE